jgi:hypothetical protein
MVMLEDQGVPKVKSQCISENGMPMHADILFYEMPCCILCSVRVPPNLGGFLHIR